MNVLDLFAVQPVECTVALSRRTRTLSYTSVAYDRLQSPLVQLVGSEDSLDTLLQYKENDSGQCTFNS